MQGIEEAISSPLVALFALAAIELAAAPDDRVAWDRGHRSARVVAGEGAITPMLGDLSAIRRQRSRHISGGWGGGCAICWV